MHKEKLGGVILPDQRHESIAERRTGISKVYIVAVCAH